MKSLRWKLILIYVALVFIASTISGTYIIISLQNQENNKVEDELKSSARLILDSIEGNEVKDFVELLRQTAKYSATNIQGNILDMDGFTIASTLATENLPVFKDSAIVSALTNNTATIGKDIRDRDANGTMREWMSYAYPVKIGENNYIIYVRSDIGHVINRVSSIKSFIFISIVIAMFFACIVGTLLAGTITKPIKTLAGKAKELARGELDMEIPVMSDDEIGQLTQNFNFMARELNNTVSVISSENNKLEILLHNMTDGVLAFNGKYELIHANKSSLMMLDILNPAVITVRKLSTLFNADLFKLFHSHDQVQVQAQEKRVSEYERFIGERFIKASFVPYYGKDEKTEGVIVVLQDMTQQKKLDTMRKEFVANVSHEIRTPLTTIKSYTETLLFGAIDDREIAYDFLNTINAESDRMTILVKDLLLLSKMDGGKLDMDLKAIKLNKLINDNVSQFRNLAKKNNQTLTYKQCSNDLIILADIDRMRQIISNVISNAIKYSGNGAQINVYTVENPDYCEIIIEDNGVGIPEKDLERIFERFYRVDKTRSREMGGTGLGLAIAKEIAQAQNGDIRAESIPGKGTKMTIFIPIYKESSENLVEI